MLAPNRTSNEQPIAIVGAGQLISHVYRDNDESNPNNYRFNVFRLTSGLTATHELRPSDLRDIVKLCQVLGVSIVDDGWIPSDTKLALSSLVEDLDSLTQGWSDRTNE